MKKLIPIFLILAFPACDLYAQQENKQSVRAKLTQASVYLQGASLTHTATTSLKSGAQEILIEGLSPEIETASLKVSVTGFNIISSIEFSNDFISNKKESAQIQKLRDSLKIYQKQLQETGNALSVNNKLLKTLSDGISNNTQQKEKPLSPAEISANMDLYKSKAPGLQAGIDEYRERQTLLNQHIARIKQQLQQDESKELQRSGVVSVNVSAPMAGKADFTVTYYTERASWSPCYDIQVRAIGQPVLLTAKAEVRQMTGLDWEQVKLNLSNARPNHTNTAPVFNTWFLHYISSMNRGVYANLSAGPSKTLAKGRAKTLSADMSLESAAMETNAADVTNETVYLLNGVEISQSEYQSISPSYIASVEILQAEEAVHTYGRKATTYVITTKDINDFIELQENEVEASYNIALPYTVCGNGKAQMIELKKHEIKAGYHYYAAPKLSDETYLMASLTDWEQYRLLPGPASVSYNGTYVGKTQLHTGTTNKSLLLTLATEPRISVKREKRTNYSSTRTLGNNTTETRSYTLSVRNNTSKPVSLSLNEQYPVSTNKDMEINLGEVTPPASTDKTESGLLTWNLELAAGESKTFTVTYSVKHPKERKINLDE